MNEPNQTAPYDLRDIAPLLGMMIAVVADHFTAAQPWCLVAVCFLAGMVFDRTFQEHSHD